MTARFQDTLWAGDGKPFPTSSGESDPTGRTANTPGAKLDNGKTKVLQGALHYFPLAIAAVAGVSEIGARKYTWRGWESVPDGVQRYNDALARHLLQEGPHAVTTDLDTGALHAAHVAWNALAVLELLLREQRLIDKGEAREEALNL